MLKEIDSELGLAWRFRGSGTASGHRIQGRSYIKHITSDAIAEFKETGKFSASTAMHEHVIIGGGIVGLATAASVGNKYLKASIPVLEKEQDIAQHQPGRNSDVIHSGIYYKPGSFKARFARAGARSIVDLCQEHGIPTTSVARSSVLGPGS